MYNRRNEELLNTASLVRNANYWCVRNLVNNEVEGLRESIEKRTHRIKYGALVMREYYERLLADRRAVIG